MSLPPSNWPCSDLLAALLARCGDYRNHACLTLTAIHPDGQRRTPSRHIPLNQPDQLRHALQRLLSANRLGWGAYFAVGLRRPGLRRWRRGGLSDVVALPAVFVDLDDPRPSALARLRAFELPPSCIVGSGGGGFHAYWWLDVPTTAFDRAGHILRALTRHFGGDRTSLAQSLRLPESINTKPNRGGRCRIIELNRQWYTLNDLEAVLAIDDLQFNRREKPYITVQTVHTVHNRRLNAAVVRAVSDRFAQMDYVRHGDWLSGPCLYPAHHQHGDVHHSFGFNLRSGYANCFRCGSMLLKDVCASLGIQPADYGGLFVHNERKQV